MATKKLVIANWKQNMVFDETAAWCTDFGRLLKDGKLSERVKIVVCPPAPFIEKVHQMLHPLGVLVGVQDVSAFEDGAHTGYVGVNQTKHFTKYAIVGHSERGEDCETVAKKVELCTKAGIVPIVCFKSPDQYKKFSGAVYALEDPQNISQNGLYRAKSPDEVCSLVREARRFFGDGETIVYGGSVNEENTSGLVVIEGIDGFLVGRASLDPVAFYDIVSKLPL